MEFPMCMLLYTPGNMPEIGGMRHIQKKIGNFISGFCAVCKFRAKKKCLFPGLSKIGMGIAME
jgi:hypothetical protein